MSYTVKVLHVDDFGNPEEVSVEYEVHGHQVTDLVFEQRPGKDGRPEMTFRAAGQLRLELDTVDQGVVVFPDVTKIVYILSKQWQDMQKKAHEASLAQQDKAKVVDIGGPTK